MIEGHRATISMLLGRCRFPEPGTAVNCAVSGGADSLALLVLAAAAGCRVTAVHVDHGMRAGSAAEATLVAAAASRVGAGFEARAVSVTEGPNLEARARAARYAALPPGALTGHTADDQAETIVLNLLRGAGLDGLAGIRDDGRRPLLALRRAETRALCAQVGLRVLHDATNDDRRFRRNRVRAEVLPLLDAVGERDVAAVLARQAHLLAADADVLDALAGELDPTDVRALRSAPSALARRAVRAWLRPGSDSECHPPDAATVERVLAVVRGESRAAEIGGGRRVIRSSGVLRVAPVGPSSGGPGKSRRHSDERAG